MSTTANGRRFTLAQLEAGTGGGEDNVGNVDIKPVACPKCGGKLGGPHKSRCYRCSPSGKAKANRLHGETDSDDSTGWPKTHRGARPPGLPGDLVARARSLTTKLPAGEARVIRARYNLDGGGFRTQVETARLLGFGATKVGKLESRALARLKAQGVDLKAAMQPEPDPDMLPLPAGFAAGKKANGVGSIDTAPPSAEAAARRLVLRTLLDLPPDAAARIIAFAAEAVGVAPR